MCPELERHERELHLDLSEFEMLPGIAGTPRIDHRKAVKKYHRPAAGNEIPLPEEVRTSETLRRTLSFLWDEILADSSAPLSERYNFIRDRARAIRQDFTLQSLRDENFLTVNQEIARFHIALGYLLQVESHRGQSPNVSSFQNTEQLRKVLQSLHDAYQDIRVANSNSSLLAQEPEFLSYYLITHLQDKEAIQKTSSFSKALIQSDPIRFALDCFNFLHRNDFFGFFNLLRQSNFLQACLLFEHFPAVRKAAFLSLSSSLNRAEGVPLLWIQSQLAFDSEDQIRQILSSNAIEVAWNSQLECSCIFLKSDFDYSRLSFANIQPPCNSLIPIDSIDLQKIITSNLPSIRHVFQQKETHADTKSIASGLTNRVVGVFCNEYVQVCLTSAGVYHNLVEKYFLALLKNSVYAFLAQSIASSNQQMLEMKHSIARRVFESQMKAMVAEIAVIICKECLSEEKSSKLEAILFMQKYIRSSFLIRSSVLGWIQKSLQSFATERNFLFCSKSFQFPCINQISSPLDCLHLIDKIRPAAIILIGEPRDFSSVSAAVSGVRNLAVVNFPVPQAKSSVSLAVEMRDIFTQIGGIFYVPEWEKVSLKRLNFSELYEENFFNSWIPSINAIELGSSELREVISAHLSLVAKLSGAFLGPLCYLKIAEAPPICNLGEFLSAALVLFDRNSIPRFICNESFEYLEKSLRVLIDRLRFQILVFVANKNIAKQSDSNTLEIKTLLSRLEKDLSREIKADRDQSQLLEKAFAAFSSEKVLP